MGLILFIMGLAGMIWDYINSEKVKERESRPGGSNKGLRLVRTWGAVLAGLFAMVVSPWDCS